MNLIKEEGVAGQGLIPKTLKHFNARITFTPSQSETKEIKIKFNLIAGRNTESGLELVQPLGAIFAGLGSSGIEYSGQESHNSEEAIKYEIRRICQEHHSAPYKVERCVEEHEEVESVRLIESEKEEIEEICSQSFYGEEEKKMCRKGVKVCHKAKAICEEGPTGERCQEKKDQCITLKRTVEKLATIAKKLQQEIEGEEPSTVRVGGASLEGIVSGIAIHTSLQQRHGSPKTANVVLVGGYTQSGRNIRTVTELICETSQSPRYEIVLRTATRLPEVLYRWNLIALLEQRINMDFDAELSFGRVGEQKTKVSLRSTLKKSENQKEAVRASPEYKRCQEQERQSRPLSAVCMEARHQAGSVDTITAELSFPKNIIERSPLLTKLGNGIKAALISNLATYNVNNEESYPVEGTYESLSNNEQVTLAAYFNRAGTATNVTVKTGGQTYHLKNVRMPTIVCGVMPLSLRNGVANRLIQKVTNDQAPASCTIDHSFVNTFDNRTYGYQLNECEHLLFKDCSGMRPVAVTASKKGGNFKKITILSGPHKVEMKPTSSFGGAIEIFVDGHLERISHNKEYTRKSASTGKVVLKIYLHKDGVVAVENPIEKLTVFFDNKKIEIVAAQRFHNRACGLCGDLNQENTADLKSPQKCLFSQDRFAAYSYMINGEHCSAERMIPTEDRPAYERDLQECVKTRTVTTPVTVMARDLLELAPKPTTVKHLIQKEANRLCLSKKMQKICPTSSSARGGQSAEVAMPFACFTWPSSKAEQLLKRAEAGEVLPTVMTRPTMYSKNVVITLSCGEEPYVPTESIFGEEETYNYRIGGREGRGF